MNTTIQKSPTRETGTIHRRLIGLLAGMLLAPLPTTAGAEDSFQQNVLFNPTAAQLKAEARGRVMIYDGLDNAVVERAIDAQFDRMESMMFVRTRHTAPDGEVSYADDGCD